MMSQPSGDSSSSISLTPRRVCGVARGRAAMRGMLMLAGGAILMFPAYIAAPSIRFTPTTTASRITDYALAIAVGVPLIVGVVLIALSLRWLLLAIWPGPLKIYVDGSGLELHLGPFGRRKLEWSRMDMSYSYEREDDPDEEPDPELLALEPEEEMVAHLPRMRHPRVQGDVRWLILRFADAEEAEIARIVHPYVLESRKRSSRSS